MLSVISNAMSQSGAPGCTEYGNLPPSTAKDQASFPISYLPTTGIECPVVQNVRVRYFATSNQGWFPPGSQVAPSSSNSRPCNYPILTVWSWFEFDVQTTLFLNWTKHAGRLCWAGLGSGSIWWAL